MWKQENHLRRAFLVYILESFSLMFVFQNSSSAADSSVESVESTLRSVPAVRCRVRKREREEERKKTKGKRTRNSRREWASDCEARSHEHEDVREVHLDDSMKSVGFRNFLCLLYRLRKND